MIEDNAVVTYHDVSLSMDTEGHRFPVAYIASEGHGGGYLRMSVEEARKLGADLIFTAGKAEAITELKADAALASPERPGGDDG